MLSYTYLSPGKFGLIQKPKPVLRHDRDAIVRVTLSSICTSDCILSTAQFHEPFLALRSATKWLALWNLSARKFPQ